MMHNLHDCRLRRWVSSQGLLLSFIVEFFVLVPHEA